MRWYLDAYYFARSLDNVVFRACGVISSLSPQMSWDKNKDLAKRLYEGERSGLHYGTQIAKAEDCLEATGWEEVNNIISPSSWRKTVAFYNNILWPNTSGKVTIDRHAIAIALNRKFRDDERPDLTKNQYLFLERAYAEASGYLNILPHQLQAITWVAWRNIVN